MHIRLPNPFITALIAIFCLFSGANAQNGAETDPRCPTRDHVLLREDQVEPKAIDEFLSGHAGELRRVDDLICCLPKSYRRQFVVVHSSVSAQTSDIHGMRVILYGKKPAEPGKMPALQSAISFNGGAENLGNHDHVEMIYNSSEAELYDIPFDEGPPRVSHKNPELCLACHGERGQLALGGPKTIFEDVDQWTRSVQGIHVAEEEEPLARAIERAAERTFRTNPRYRCLDQTIAHEHHFSGHLTSTAPELEEIDSLLADMNERRVARLVRATPEYEKYKYAIIGSLACFQFENCTLDDAGVKRPNACGADFSRWIPPNVLAKMNDTKFVDSRLRASRDLKDTVMGILRDGLKQYQAAVAAQPETIRQLDAGGNPYIEIYRGPFRPNNGANGLKVRRKDLDAKIQAITPLDFYKADSEIRSVRGQLFNPFFQYIFEARGLDIGGFSMDPLPDSYTRSPTGFLITELMKLEKQGSVLRSLKSRMIEAQIMAPDVWPENGFPKVDDVTLLNRRRQACDALQSLSYSALMQGQ